jgi:hypothetical protein
MNYKDTKPYTSAFLSVDLLTDFAAFCLTDFIDWRYTHSWFVLFDPACELLPPWTKELYLCTVAPLQYLLSDLLPPPPFAIYSKGGGGVLKCTVDHILQEFYTQFLTRFRTYKIASPPQTKLTSNDDIEGLGSLKFLRPWPHPWDNPWPGLHSRPTARYAFRCTGSPPVVRPLLSTKNTQEKLWKDDIKSTSVPNFWREVAFYIVVWLTSTTGMPTMPKMYLTPSFTEKENILKWHLEFHNKIFNLRKLCDILYT